MANQPANTLTAEEFAAQGTTPGTVLSLAGYYVRELNDHATAGRLRTIAREVSLLTGIALPKRRKRKHHNDNAKRQTRRAA